MHAMRKVSVPVKARRLFFSRNGDKLILKRMRALDSHPICIKLKILYYSEKEKWIDCKSK